MLATAVDPHIRIGGVFPSLFIHYLDGRFQAVEKVISQQLFFDFLPVWVQNGD
jgi:hypothetical protein